MQVDDRHSQIPFSEHAGRRETAIVAMVAAGLAVSVAVLFTLAPGLDLAASRLFHDGPTATFPHGGNGVVQGVREVFLRLFTLWYLVVIGAAILAWRWKVAVLNLSAERWIFIALCSIAGPLLLVNVVLKEFWGRWRPWQVTEFGGIERFTPPLDWSGTCPDNCSFVSGEVSSMAMIFIGLAFATRHWRPIHYGLLVTMGGLETFIRVSQGGHFLSDALLAGCFMVLVAASIHWLLFLRPDGPFARPADAMDVPGPDGSTARSP